MNMLNVIKNNEIQDKMKKIKVKTLNILHLKTSDA